MISIHYTRSFRDLYPKLSLDPENDCKDMGSIFIKEITPIRQSFLHNSLKKKFTSIYDRNPVEN